MEGKSALDLKHISGLSPFDSKPDDPKRFELFNRLRHFYTRFDAVRVTTGIGSIVDWTLRNGEDALNQRLLIKYGENLQTLEALEAQEQEKKEKTDVDDKLFVPTIDPVEVVESNKKSESSAPIKPSMRQILTEFYRKHDPARIENGLDKIIEYIAVKGIDALNKKLMKKYGECLDLSDDVKVENIKRNSNGSFAPFFTTLAKESDQDTAEVKQNRNSPSENALTGPPPIPPPKVVRTVPDLEPQPSKKVGLSSDKPEALNKNLKLIAQSHPTPKLPDYVRPMLSLYYSLYDPSKLQNGGLEVIITWTQKNGVPALNAKLEEKYNESLDAFAARANGLRDELIDFYTRVDRMKLVKGLDDVLRWCLRNGREPLNELLRQKYGCDLDSDRVVDFDNKPSEFEPNF